MNSNYSSLPRNNGHQNIRTKPRPKDTNENGNGNSKVSQKRKDIQQIRQYIWEYKSNHPCVKCDESDPSCLVFHHRDPSIKEKDISNLLKSGLAIVKREIKKCDMLCSNCHLKWHYHEDHPG